MPGTDLQQVEKLFPLRARMNPFEPATIIRRKLDRIWSMRQVHGKPVSAQLSVASEAEIVRILSRTLAVTNLAPKNHRSSAGQVC
jgi:hypothetical protein